MSAVSQKSAMGSNVEGDDSGDDVDLPEMSGDSLTDDSEDDSEKVRIDLEVQLLTWYVRTTQ